MKVESQWAHSPKSLVQFQPLPIKYNMTNLFNSLQITLINITMVFMIITLFLIVMQRNPVYAVFSFILTALSVFFFLILIGAEFLALLILIIYTGVITVLFLFVVIMYNLRDVKLYIHNLLYNPLVVVVAFKIYWAHTICWNVVQPLLKQTISLTSDNLYTLDVIQFVALFNEHSIMFLGCGLLLFIAMIGSIVITYPFTKHQK